MTGRDYYEFKGWLRNNYVKVDYMEVSFVYHSLWKWMDRKHKFTTMFDASQKFIKDCFRNVIPFRYLNSIDEDSYVGLLQSFDEIRSKGDFDKSLDILPIYIKQEQLVRISQFDYTGLLPSQKYFVKRMQSYRLRMMFGYDEEYFHNIYLLPSEYENVFDIINLALKGGEN